MIQMKIVRKKDENIFVRISFCEFFIKDFAAFMLGKSLADNSHSLFFSLWDRNRKSFSAENKTKQVSLHKS